MLKFVSLKGDGYTVEYSLAVLEIEIECAKKEGVGAIKVLHGYGSHGKGGVIAQEVRKQLRIWKRQGFVKDFFGGDKWDMFEKETQEILLKDKSIYGDEDLGHANAGITIIVL